jgi:hypothetical protein
MLFNGELGNVACFGRAFAEVHVFVKRGAKQSFLSFLSARVTFCADPRDSPGQRMEHQPVPMTTYNAYEFMVELRKTPE